PPLAEPHPQRLDTVLPVDDEEQPRAGVDGGRAELLRIELGHQPVHPGLVEVPLRQRVDPHPVQRHPPQVGQPLHPHPSGLLVVHRVVSFICFICLTSPFSTRIEALSDATQPSISAGSRASTSTRPTPISSPSTVATVSRTIRLESRPLRVRTPKATSAP